MKEQNTNAEEQLIMKLVVAMNSGGQKPLRRQLCKTVVYRDRVLVAWRYLRRFAGGSWHRGGNHTARLSFGPGIAFRGLRNDRVSGFQAFPINLSEGGSR